MKAQWAFAAVPADPHRARVSAEGAGRLRARMCAFRCAIYALALLPIALTGCGSSPTASEPTSAPASTASIAASPTGSAMDRAATEASGRSDVTVPTPSSGDGPSATTASKSTEWTGRPSARPPTVRATSRSPLQQPTLAGALPSADELLGKPLVGGTLGPSFHLAAIRSGEHDGYTRIVWEMDEAAGAPRWSALLRRDVEGTAVIDITLSDVVAIQQPDAMAAQAVQSPVVDSVQPRRIQDDAVVGFAIRLARPAGYAVTLLEAPVRVVVDVAHAP